MTMHRVARAGGLDVRSRVFVMGLVGVTLLAGALAGCGYSQRGLYREDVRSVAVPIFENRTNYRGLEREATEALIKELELRTPYKVVAGDAADTVLHATITRVDQTSLGREPQSGFVRELEASIVIDLEWKDLRSGKVLASRKGFASVGRYTPERPVGEPLAVAERDATQRLAQDVVTLLESQW